MSILVLVISCLLDLVIDFPVAWPSTHSTQNASAVQLALLQPNCGVAVICRPAHARPLLPFVPSAHTCRSQHIHRMLLSDVAVTTEQHQENIWFRFWQRDLY